MSLAYTIRTSDAPETTAGIRRRLRNLAAASGAALAFAALAALCPAEAGVSSAAKKAIKTDSLLPVIINTPFTVKPGAVFSLSGSGFGTAPRLFVKPSRQLVATELPIKTSDDSTVAAQIPSAMALDVYEFWVSNGLALSPHVLVNTPQAHHFDSADIATGAHFRVFGRNLYMGSGAPTATLIDVDTGAQLKGVVGVAASSLYALDVTAPAGVLAGHKYRVSISNGYGSTQSAATVLGHAPGTDRFAIGQPWAYDFITADGPGYKAGVKGANPADHHVFNVKTDVTLSVKAKGDGVANDGPAIMAALAAAMRYGGIVYLPAGTYNIGSTSLTLWSNVVLQGQSAATTKIVYTGTKPGFIICPNASMTGLVDLTLQNKDTTSTTANLGTWGQPVSKVIIQRVVWDLGTGLPLFLQGDRIAILNSTFTQAINYQLGDKAAQTGGVGPLALNGIANFWFKNNTVKWATGQNMMNDIVNGVVENNHFTRSASDTVVVGPAQLSWPYIGKPIALGDVISRSFSSGRHVSMNFGTNLVVQSNAFDTSDGVPKINFNDGETILNEGGGYKPREDFGTVTSASRVSIADASKCVGACSWKLYSNSKVIIVSGAGAGQWRNVVALNGDELSLDAPFDVTPAPGDHFAVSAPSFENVIIRNNTMTGNPFGIAMYHGVFLNVSVVGNQLTNNGGIYLTPSQANQSAGRNYFNVSRNIEINSNILKNTNGQFPSYVSICFVVITQNSFWGKSVIGAEVRDNQITARAGTFPYLYDEGFNHYTLYQNGGGGPYADDNSGAMWGTVWQGNSCANCQVNYRLNTGSFDTTIWNAKTINSPGFVSTFLTDGPMGAGTTRGSTRTLVGKD